MDNPPPRPYALLMTPTVQKVLGALVLMVLGVLSLPLVASLFDGEGTENWIIPVQLILMAIIGAVVTLALPSLASASASTTTRALTGAGWGVLAALIGLVVFFFLLNGFDGA